MTLASATLSQASLSQGIPDSDSRDDTPPPPHLMVAVDLRKGSEGERYHHFAALVDSGATYNFISQAVADRLGLQPARSGRRWRRAVRQPPLVAAVNGKLLRTTAVVRQIVRMCDSAGVKRTHVVNFVIAYICSYDVILGMAWLQKQNPDIN